MASRFFREVIRGRAAERRRMRNRGVSPTEENRKVALLLSVSLLLEAREACLRGPDEELLLVEGFHLDPNTTVGSRLLKPEYARQGLAGVVAEPLSVRDLIMEMHERGHCLACILHSHPGSGPKANRPSRTDRDTQARYELGGGVCIGGIFSRGAPAYLRFFSVRTRFRVLVYGTGIKEVKKNVFRFANETAVQASPPATEEKRRLVVLR